MTIIKTRTHWNWFVEKLFFEETFYHVMIENIEVTTPKREPIYFTIHMN